MLAKLILFFKPAGDFNTPTPQLYAYKIRSPLGNRVTLNLIDLFTVTFSFRKAESIVKQGNSEGPFLKLTNV